MDDSIHVHFWHVTDDVIVHPLSPTYLDRGEMDNPRYAMDQAAKKKRVSYERLSLPRAALQPAGHGWPAQDCLQAGRLHAIGSVVW